MKQSDKPLRPMSEPPRREDFIDEETYLEAFSRWRRLRTRPAGVKPKRD